MPVDERVLSLTYAVRASVVWKYLGQLFLLVAIASIVPLCISLGYNEYASSLRYLAVIIALSVFTLATTRIPAPRTVQHNEALIVTALVFLLVPLIMAYPVTGHGLAFADALFETVSAITTTGLTLVSDVEEKGQTFLFSRAWMQWYGGLGIVVLSVALLMGPGVAARRFSSIGTEWENLISGARLHARRVFTVYLILTAAGVTALWMTGIDWRTALLHALAGVSTGGFSTYNNNMAGLGDWQSQAVLMALTLCGAVSLAIYHPAYYRNWRELNGHIEVRGLLVISAAVIALLGCCMLVVGGYPWSSVLRDAPLVALSAQTGAGFSSMSIGSLDPASKLILIVSMVIGGGVGSTAGGIKILRFLILLRLIQLLVQRACMPAHAVVVPHIAGHRLESREVEHALLIILLFVVVIILSWFVFLVLGYPPLDSLFDVVSATATVGLSAGVTSDQLPVVLKGVLCLDMLLGRLEIVALLLVLYPRAWFGRRME